MKRAFFTLILFTFSILIMAQGVSDTKKPQLIYFGDPMCSWCFGFSPELSKAVSSLDDEIEVQLVMGGLRPYNTEVMTDLKDFLTHHWEEVSKRSGQKFSYEILDSDKITYDTEPPSRAVVIIRDLHPGHVFEFFKEVQVLFYQKNKNMHLAETYFQAVEAIGMNKQTFENHFNSEEYKQKIKKDFEKSSEMGVRSFPTMMLKKGDELFIISNGYTEAEKLVDSIKRHLN